MHENNLRTTMKSKLSTENCTKLVSMYSVFCLSKQYTKNGFTFDVGKGKGKGKVKLSIKH
jgi:hypothetical protein